MEWKLLITVIAWIASILLLLLAAYISIMNWYTFVNNCILKKPFVSAVPFGCGLFGALGIVLLPIEGSWIWLWVPSVIDWGSFPIVIVSIICAIKRKSNQTS
jgi:hypothetical protein